MMAQHLNEELEYMVDDYFDMAEFDDDEFWENQQQREAAEGFDLEGDADVVQYILIYFKEVRFFLDCLVILVALAFQSKQKTDTSAYEFRNGKDMQGIPWERLNYSRDKYREMRLKQYKNYENLSRSREALEKVRTLISQIVLSRMSWLLATGLSALIYLSVNLNGYECIYGVLFFLQHANMVNPRNRIILRQKKGENRTSGHGTS